MRVSINRKEMEGSSGLIFKKKWKTYLVGVKVEISDQERDILARYPSDYSVAELTPLYPNGPGKDFTIPQLYTLRDVLGSGRGYTFLTPVEANAAELRITEGLKELKQIIEGSELPPEGSTSFEL